PAVRRSSGVSRTSPGHRDRVPQRQEALAAHRSRSPRELVRDVARGAHREVPTTGSVERETSGGASAVPLLAPAPADDLRILLREWEREQRARRPGLLLHLLLQR